MYIVKYELNNKIKKEERKLVEILGNMDSKECSKNKIQHYLDENKH